MYCLLILLSDNVMGILLVFLLRKKGFLRGIFIKLVSYIHKDIRNNFDVGKNVSALYGYFGI